MSDFKSVWERYHQLIYKIAFVYLGNESDSEDALQEVLIKYYSAAPKFKDEAHEKAWIIRVTQNKCRDILRAASRKNIPLDAVTIYADDENRDRRLDVLKSILTLNVRCKSVFLLYYYYDYSVADIAHTLKISESAVKMRLKRGREQLKTELEEYKDE